MTFLDVVNPPLAKCPNDSARRALIVRLLAVLGHDAVPEVWRLKWEGRTQVVYSWVGSPAGDLWLAGGRLHADLRVEDAVLMAPLAPSMLANEAVEDLEEDVWAGLSPAAMVQVHAAYRLVADRLHVLPSLDLTRYPPAKRNALHDIMAECIRELSRAA